MWRHKIRVALAHSPAFAEVTEDGLRGRYLHVAGFSKAPSALGPARFRRGDAHVHDLLALREGENLLMAEICQHPTGSEGYRRWQEDVKQRVGPAAEKNIPVFAQPLRCGTVICVYPYMSPSPETAWESLLPTHDIRTKIVSGDLDDAVALCERAIAQHGRKAILLQGLAEIRHQGGNLESARTLFLESIKAHRADGNAGLLSASRTASVA